MNRALDYYCRDVLDDGRDCTGPLPGRLGESVSQGREYSTDALPGLDEIPGTERAGRKQIK